MKETLMLLSTRIEERRKELLESMGAGTAKDFGGYQHACGEVRGYLIIQNMISEALRTHEHEEENFDSSPTDNVVTMTKPGGKKLITPSQLQTKK